MRNRPPYNAKRAGIILSPQYENSTSWKATETFALLAILAVGFIALFTL